MTSPLHILRKDPVPGENGVRYLSEVTAYRIFQQNYLALREKEQRVLPDKLVFLLPNLPVNHPLHNEWRLRAGTLQRFSTYMKKSKPAGPILDLGCGNGWFTHKMHELTREKTIGLDVNVPELEQAARIFNKQGIEFCFGNIFEEIFHPKSFKIITLNASAQYFPDIPDLINRLLFFLKDDGEIHFLDTHFYKDEISAKRAAERSWKYYSNLGFPEMASHYHHHLLLDLMSPETVVVDILYNLTLKIQPLKLFRRNRSRFPWIRIMKSR